MRVQVVCALFALSAARLAAATDRELVEGALRALAKRGVPEERVARVVVDVVPGGPHVELKLRAGADGVLLRRGSPRETSELALSLKVTQKSGTIAARWTLDLVGDGRILAGGEVERPADPAAGPATDPQRAVQRAVDALGAGGPALVDGRLALERLEDQAPVREVKLRELARGGAPVARDERPVPAGTLVWQYRVDPALRPPPPPNPWDRSSVRKLDGLSDQLVYWALSRALTPPSSKRPARAKADGEGKSGPPRVFNQWIENAGAAAVKRAVAALKREDLHAAERELRMALRAAPRDLTATKALAATLLVQSRYAEVVRMLEPVRGKHRADAGVALMLARAHLGLREPEAALPLLEDVRKRDPRFADLPFHFGVAYFYADRHADAITAFRARAIVSPALRAQARRFVDAARQLSD